ncbi:MULTISPECIES: glycosyltransferase family 2 protein [Campylobacter]|uniref:glycosyltransferase family 2 protein n=1 Tax=Campylobacter TaxID=194 RepID=UPI000942C641|nr:MULTISPECIES: glycosyltransferase family 2 protein [Campylobacter]OKY03061.1 hypothetical protein A0M39_06300 [Campylobacter jejuni]PCH30507.1 glycosyltransferase family 2 protein [Campylobacter sp. 113]RTI88570.1 glycosyltransferase family 2 protein [Campylobacter jejuni]RTJ24243.1 glycosyltransferase family 2 protein [Campylobacter jejuni]HDZ4292370.1 glycosyltransferase family 2 protein [Campylobacter jejuni]
MQSKTVGVVIPIYNVQDYLKECLDNVINQTYKNLQVVLVNDGSTDENSLNIAKEYTLKDERFILFDKKNGGHSSAKNVGIEYFSKEYKLKHITNDIKENSLIEFSIEGNNEIYKVYKSSKFFKNKDELLNFQAPNIDYIIFLDSDDYWELNCIEECVSRMEGANVVWFDFQPEIENNFKKQFKTEMEVLDCKNEEIISTKDWLEICEKKKYLFWFAWQGMIEFKSLLRSKLKFIDKIIHEDHHFGICLFSSIEKIYIYPQKKYHYRVRKNSVSHQNKFHVDKTSYLYDLFQEFRDDIYEFKNYQLAMNWAFTLSHMVDFLSLNNYEKVEKVFLSQVLSKALRVLFLTKDPYNLIEILKIYKNYFLKYQISKEEFIRNSLEYQIGYLILKKKIFSVNKVMKRYNLQVKKNQNYTREFFIQFLEDKHDFGTQKIKKHLSYRLGKFLCKIVLFWRKT